MESEGILSQRSERQSPVAFVTRTACELDTNMSFDLRRSSQMRDETEFITEEMVLERIIDKRSVFREMASSKSTKQ